MILLDINMPGMNGWDLMDEIGSKRYRSQVHIVIVTSSVNRADHERAKLCGMVVDYIEKPISPEECKRIMHMPAIAKYF